MIILTVILLILDIISKMIVKKYLVYNESIVIIKNLLNITYVNNTGAAWSIFDSNTLLVLVVSGIIILGLIYYIYKNKPNNKVEKMLYSFVLSGAIGNFITRIIYGYVIDFIDMKIFGYDYPIFNLADIFIVLGVFGIVIYTWRCSHDGSRSRK